MIKEIWAFRENRIAVRFAYEWHDDSGNWFRSYGNENWEFDEHGLMRLRIASINDAADQRKRAQISLAARPPPRRSPVLERPRPVTGAPCPFELIIEILPPWSRRSEAVGSMQTDDG